MDENKMVKENKLKRIEELKKTIHTEAYQDFAIERIAGSMSNIIFDHKKEAMS